MIALIAFAWRPKKRASTRPRRRRCAAGRPQPDPPGSRDAKLRQRRALGVAAFAYAFLHTVVYLARKVDVGLIIEEGMAPDLATGWVALAVFAVLAMTSNDASIRFLRRKWKPVHRLVYAGALLTFAHWVLAAFDPAQAYVYFAILAAFEATRVLLPLARQR